MPKITKIEATINPLTHVSFDTIRKRKVAAYARVSTSQEEQSSSYEAQVDYYTKYINSNNEWEFVGVYTDEGISGTSTKKRDGFNNMIADALDGKIDLIITKSVSRFARNTVDTLTNIRNLKEHGVEVFFEKENIYTFGAGGELLLTIMSSTAQEESRSISSNVTWGIRKSFSDGKVFLPYKHFLGYKKGENGLPEIVPEEAKIVQEIYSLYIKGFSQSTIAKILMDNGVKSPSGKDKWNFSVIDSIIKNEKYKGDAKLQKKYTVDFLTKKQKKNEGEVPQYYVENSHPAIIDPKEWDLVQAEIYYRDQLPSRVRNATPISGKLICGDCGSIYGPKVWHSTDQYKKTIWRCNNKYNKELDIKCSTPNITEEQIKILFLKALDLLLGDKKKLISDIKAIKEQLFDVSFKKEMSETANEMKVISVLAYAHIKDNAKKNSDSDEYMQTYMDLCNKYYAVQKKYNELMIQQYNKQMKSIMLDGFIDEMANLGTAKIEFDDRLFNITTEKITIYHDSTIKFKFKNNIEITLNINEA